MTAHHFIKNVYNVSVFRPLPFLRCCRPFPAHQFIKNVYNVFVFWPLPFLRCCRPFPMQHCSAARLPFPACRAQLPQALCRKGLQRPADSTKAKILSFDPGLRGMQGCEAAVRGPDAVLQGVRLPARGRLCVPVAHHGRCRPVHQATHGWARCALLHG